MMNNRKTRVQADGAKRKPDADAKDTRANADRVHSEGWVPAAPGAPQKQEEVEGSKPHHFDVCT